MDLAWDDPRTRKFVSSVGLITSNGPIGNNIMTAEWSRHASYSPSLMMINLTHTDATVKNIMETKEFGFHIAASDQNVVASTAGGSTGNLVDKISVLKDMGVKFYKAKNIDVLMVKGVAMAAECKVIKTKKLGDHRMFVGEVLEISKGEKEPLIYSNGKYWRLGEQIEKPPEEEIDKIQELVKRHKK